MRSGTFVGPRIWRKCRPGLKAEVIEEVVSCQCQLSEGRLVGRGSVRTVARQPAQTGVMEYWSDGVRLLECWSAAGYHGIRSVAGRTSQPTFQIRVICEICGLKFCHLRPGAGGFVLCRQATQQGVSSLSGNQLNTDWHAV